MKTDGILPCPFCGGVSCVAWNIYGKCCVECQDCSSNGSTEDTEAEAIELWNKRTELSNDK